MDFPFKGTRKHAISLNRVKRNPCLHGNLHEYPLISPDCAISPQTLYQIGHVTMSRQSSKSSHPILRNVLALHHRHKQGRGKYRSGRDRRFVQRYVPAITLTQLGFYCGRAEIEVLYAL